MVVKVLSPFLCVRQEIIRLIFPSDGGCLVVLNSKAFVFLSWNQFTLHSTVLVIAGIPVVQPWWRMIYLFCAGQRGVRLEIGKALFSDCRNQLILILHKDGARIGRTRA